MHKLQTAKRPVCLSACARLRRNRAPCPKRAICASAGVRANPEIRRDPASCANRHVSVQSARLRPRTRARMASLVAFGCPLRTYGLVPADGSQSSLRPRVHPRRESRMKPPGADARRTGARPSRLGGEPNSTRVTDSGDLAKQARRPHAKATSAQRPRPGVDKYLARGARLTAEGPSRRVVGRGKSPEPRQEETGG